ncbi:MAG: STAS-like domain-containing protein, partial [Gammaproteobacteria bacterium]
LTSRAHFPNCPEKPAMPTTPAMTTMTANPIDTIDIGADFSIVPRGVHYNDGDNSGQRFREEFLKPIFTEPEKYSRPVKVILDTAEAFSAAFLHEAFGGLVREGYASADEVRDALELVCERGGFWLYERLIKRSLAEAEEEQAKKKLQAAAG